MKMNSKFSLFTCLLFATFTFWSCEKDDPQPETDDDTDEMVVAIIDDALSASTSGLMYEAQVASQLAATHMIKSGNNNVCDMTFDSTLVIPYANNFITGSYNASWGWNINCNDFFLPISINLDATSANSYQTNSITSNSTSSSNWLMDNLLTGDFFEFSGEYEREGTFSIQLKELNTWTSEFSFDLTSLRFDKETLAAEGGEATFDFEGETARGLKIDVDGSIEFIGKDKAIVTINGNTYEIDLD